MYVYIYNIYVIYIIYIIYMYCLYIRILIRGFSFLLPDINKQSTVAGLHLPVWNHGREE